MDLTTLARVKTRIGESTSSQDALLSQLITAVSVQMERAMCRHAQQTARTETVRRSAAQRIFVLPGIPVVTVSSDGRTTIPFTLKVSDTNSFSGVSSSVSNSDYVLHHDTGIVRLISTYEPIRSQAGRAMAPLYAQVTYTGGLAADTATLISSYPDLAQACDDQVSYLHQRKNALGGSVTVGDSSAQHEGAYKWLPSVREILDWYQRREF